MSEELWKKFSKLSRESKAGKEIPFGGDFLIEEANEIAISSDFKNYDGKYKSRYIVDERSVIKEIKKLQKILNPNHNFFNVFIKKKSVDRQLHLHLTGQNRFISKSVIGDREYIAFTVSKKLKINVPSFQDYEIEREKARLVRKEVYSRNGRILHYTSPTGRKTSLHIRTSEKDFNLSVNKALDKIYNYNKRNI